VAALSQGTEDPSLFYHSGMIALAAGDSVTARSMLARTIQLNARFSPTQGPIAERTLRALGVGLHNEPVVAAGGKPRV
jgi:hypothetical protein